MNIKTLVIDDDEISIMLTEFLLKDSPLASEVITFSDGVYAIDYLKSKYSVDTQYVIILDINMPLMNGWEFLNEIKTVVAQENTKVFMLSSSTDSKDIDKAARLDLVRGFISKPIEAEDLIQIWELVRNQE